jgi:hypothetical protein
VRVEPLMIRLACLAPLALIACQQPSDPARNATEAQRQLEAPVTDVDAVPVDENAAAAIGEDDDAPAEGER